MVEVRVARNAAGGSPPREPAADAYERVLRAMLHVTNSSQVYLYRFQPALQKFAPALHIGAINPHQHEVFTGQQLDPATDLLASHIIANKKTLLSVNVAEDPRFRPSILAALGAARGMVLPLCVGSELLGLVLLAREKPALGYEQETVELAELFTMTAAQVMENARLKEDMSLLLGQAQSVYNITQALLQKLNLIEVMEMVCNQARGLTGAEGSSISLVEEERWLRVVHSSGETGHAAGRFSVGESLHGMVVRRGEAVLINNRAAPSHEEFVNAPRSLLAVPLRSQGRTIGVLDVVNKPAGFDGDDLRVMMLFAGQAAVAIELAGLAERLEQMAVFEERQRLARDLHDSVNQSLYAISLHAEAASRKLGANNLDAVRSNLDAVRASTRDALGEVRMLIYQLRPPVLEEKGLEDALQDRLASVERRAHLKTGFKARLTGRLPGIIEDALFGIATEALNNVLKHAEATQVTVHLIQSGRTVVLKVEDDGKGFQTGDPQLSGGMGLAGMLERAQSIGAVLTVDSHPGRGTVIMVEARA